MSKLKVFISPVIFSDLKLKKDHFDYLKSKFQLITVDGKITREQFLIYVKECFGILASTYDVIDEAVVKAAGKNLKVVSLTASGYDKVDTSAMKAHGVRVGTGGNAVVSAASEMAVALLLAASRELFTLREQYRINPLGNYAALHALKTTGLEDSTIGILGAGRIGQSVAKKLSCFSLGRLLYFSRHKKSDVEALGGEISSLERIAKESDYIVITLACNSETKHIVNEKVLNLMKPTAVIVNVGRGCLIDQDALVEALQKKKIGGAALDVTFPEPLPNNHPLFQMDNVFIIPHVGGGTKSVMKKVVELAVENIIAVAENREMPEELII